MTAEIITIGDELLIGQVVNTNAAWIGEQLHLLGVDLVRVISLGDDEQIIQDEVSRALSAAEFVVVTGGLGPTHDDVTKTAVAALFGAPLQFDEAVYEHVKARFARRGRRMAESNRTQAMVPAGFHVLPNPVGTAPGLWYVDGRSGTERLLAVLPGVPHEMRHLMLNEVLPRLREHRGLRIIVHRTLLTTGIGESDLQDRIGDVSKLLSPTCRLAYLPGTTGVRLRLTAYGHDREEVHGMLDRLEAHLRQTAGRYIFGENDDTLEAVVGRALAERGLTVAVAESCTGGYVLNRLTNTPGASAYVVGGIVAYSNRAKVGLLGVDPATLDDEGAVSGTVAAQLARGVRKRFGTDIGISTTGVAGPAGGTPDKPVGTVWIGYSDASGDHATLHHFVEERILNKELSSTAALNLIRRRITET
jgi:nicotinamide-nucleotide amidase